MKRRAITLLLSTALLTNMSACTIVPDDTDGNKAPTDVNLSESIVGDTEEPIIIATEDEETEENIPVDDESDDSNFVFRPLCSYNGRVTPNGVDEVYLYEWESQTNCRYFYIKAWDEYHLLNQEPVNWDTTYSAAVYENKAWLVSFEESGILTIRLFQKGNPQYTIIKKNVGPDYFVDILCYFFNEDIGYLFCFGEYFGVSEIGFRLDLLLKTENGGQTWEQVKVQKSPLVNWHEPVDFVKMLDENVGIVSGRYWADDYSFFKRTFITTDGGVTWDSLPQIPELIDPYTGYPGLQLEDLKQDTEGYVLIIRYRYSKDEFRFLNYYSTDLKSWTKLES